MTLLNKSGWRAAAISSLFPFITLAATPSFLTCPDKEIKIDAYADSTLLLPVPQQSSWTGRHFYIDKNWTIGIEDSYKNLPAVHSLQKEFAGRYKFTPRFSKKESANSISLTIKENTVRVGNSTDTNRAALMRQAYRLEMSKDKITVTANAPQGLFYGIQSLLQLLRKNGNGIVYPETSITDWPNMDLRMIYWDDAHHLEKIEVLKREISQAAYYKINGFAIKLEGHFDYKCAAPIVEPHALSARDYQELTDYAAAHYVQLIPYLDAPAHVSFILKHPEYNQLRAFPNSNYQFTVNNPGTYELLSCMFKELIDANKGSEYILFSNDEAYYTGKAVGEIDSTNPEAGRGKLLAKFIARMADTLKQYGRKPIFWGEYPLTKEDIQTLPSHLINGVYDSSWAPSFKQRNIRQLIYTSTQGEEPLFPNYYPLPPALSLHSENKNLEARIPGLLKTISDAVSEQKADLAGVIVAGWADAGLHPQTFWLGYATGAAMGWNLASTSAQEFTTRFYQSFYRTSSSDIAHIYELTSRQAQFYEDSWEWVPSTMRTPIFGNHAEIYSIPQPARDQSLSPLPVPSSKDLSLGFSWIDSNAARLELAQTFLKESDELNGLLKRYKSVDNNRHSIEVIESIAGLCRQNITMLFDLRKINELLTAASKFAKSNPTRALLLIDSTLAIADKVLRDRNTALTSAVKTWYTDWRPLVAEANGRKYLHAVDDVKDHRPIRTADMSYLIYRELLYPLDSWAAETIKARNDFARANRLKTRVFNFNWAMYPKQDGPNYMP